VCGDTTPFTKPHPAPLFEAARTDFRRDVNRCVYVGDDQRDIAAARAAGMHAIAAAYGYLGDDRPPTEWGADEILSSPSDLLKLLITHHLGVILSQTNIKKSASLMAQLS
jgi:N-acetyl-D-muramate 6-phosphate phosphatase